MARGYRRLSNPTDANVLIDIIRIDAFEGKRKSCLRLLMIRLEGECAPAVHNCFCIHLSFQECLSAIRIINKLLWVIRQCQSDRHMYAETAVSISCLLERIPV
jgi:hypothetical protein